MEHIDRVSHRVAISSAFGLVLGASVSILRGTSNLPRTSIAAAASCAMAATACFGAERMVNVSMSYGSFPAGLAEDYTRRLYASHVAGGLVGGALAGGALRAKPLPGAVAFVPVMLLVATAELQLREYREERLRELAETTSTGASKKMVETRGEEEDPQRS